MPQLPEIECLQEEATIAPARGPPLWEAAGAENVLDLGLGSGELLARVPTAVRPRVGATIAVAFDPAAFRYFDAATGAALAAV